MPPRKQVGAAQRVGYPFAALEAAVEADVDAFIRRGSVNAQDFETLLQTVHRRALATATRVVQAVGAQRS